jgi:hypothetical protein
MSPSYLYVAVRIENFQRVVDNHSVAVVLRCERNDFSKTLLIK